MDSAVPAAAAPAPAVAPASAPALARGPPALLGLGNPSPLLSSGQVDRSERGACLWRPWLSSTNDLPRQVRKPADLAAGGATGAEVTKVDPEFHHPVRLFWPKSRSFDYLYSDGEMLLQNFPVQATINIYEDSASEEEEEEDKEEEEEKEEADEKGPEGGVKMSKLRFADIKASAQGHVMNQCLSQDLRDDSTCPGYKSEK
ncbi:protein ripply1 [Hippopotamus amphibius kiboko]|uniref:protein ripply1 n=1 Tax=Hippopotamus amphibius kiboko TaxID=575201 RepID=UPI0025922A62|nr:protein ripply1 [Hippopotamus amphibius kiboko]